MGNSDSHAVAQAIHDLGAALWFGGSVMGVAGVNKSGEDLSRGIDRVRVASSAWSRFGPVEWAGVAANTLAGLQLTRTAKGRLALQEGYGRAGATKVAVTVAGAVATWWATYTGMQVGRIAEEEARRRGDVDVQDASISSLRTPPELETWQRRQRVAQYLVPALSGANIVLGSYLVQAHRPGATVRGLVGRLSPR